MANSTRVRPAKRLRPTGRLGKNVMSAALIAASFIGGSIAVAPAAQALTYQPSVATGYAIQYSCNENTSCRNTWYKQNSNDCANFVSQAIYQGGVDQDGTWYYHGVTSGVGDISNAWGKASTLLVWLHETKGYALHDLTRKLSAGGNVGAPDGAVIQYDWGGGESWSHVALVTGTGTYANFTSSSGFNYRTVTGTSTGTRITQHTTDRDGSPWNLGYYTNDRTWRTSARAR